MSRKSLSKKIRYEILKRDSFTCQYCGRKAPEIVLEIDHIKPVSKGGNNDLVNLITSCFDCNRGKGNRELDDNTVVEKQMSELIELNERRKQIEMIFEWREELSDLTEETVGLVADYIGEAGDVILTEHAYVEIKKWVKKYDLDLLLEVVDISYEQYEDKEKAFNMIPRIIYHKENKTPEWKQELFYIRAIARNRYNYINEWVLLDLFERAYLEQDVSLEMLQEMVFNKNSYTQLKKELEGLLDVN